MRSIFIITFLYLMWRLWFVGIHWVSLVTVIICLRSCFLEGSIGLFLEIVLVVHV